MSTYNTIGNESWEIARRVLKSYYGKEPEEEQVRDLGMRIHEAADDLSNEELECKSKDKCCARIL